MKRNRFKTSSYLFRNVFRTLLLFILIGVMTFGFLSLFNWSIDLQEWTKFSRFILGVIGVIFLIKLWDDI